MSRKETEKDIPETEMWNERQKKSPEATAGQDATKRESPEADDDKETKSKTSFFGKTKKDNKLEQQIEGTDRQTENVTMAEFDNFRKVREREVSM